MLCEMKWLPFLNCFTIGNNGALEGSKSVQKMNKLYKQIIL
jgi:hypothetical protein